MSFTHSNSPLTYQEDYRGKRNFVTKENCNLPFDLHEPYDQQFLRLQKLMRENRAALHTGCVALRPLCEQYAIKKPGIYRTDRYRVLMLLPAESVQPPRWMSQNPLRLHLTELQAGVDEANACAFEGVDGRYPLQFDLRRNVRSVCPALTVRQYNAKRAQSEERLRKNSVGGLITEALAAVREEEPVVEKTGRQLLAPVSGELSVYTDELFVDLVITQPGHAEKVTAFRFKRGDFLRLQPVKDVYDCERCGSTKVVAVPLPDMGSIADDEGFIPDPLEETESVSAYPDESHIDFREDNMIEEPVELVCCGKAMRVRPWNKNEEARVVPRMVRKGELIATIVGTMEYAEWEGDRLFKGGSRDVAILPSAAYPRPCRNAFAVHFGTLMLEKVLDAASGERVDIAPRSRAFPKVLAQVEMDMEEFFAEVGNNYSQAAHSAMFEGLRHSNSGKKLFLRAELPTGSWTLQSVTSHTLVYRSEDRKREHRQTVNPHAVVDPLLAPMQEDAGAAGLVLSDGDIIGDLVPRRAYRSWGEIAEAYPEALADCFRELVNNLKVMPGSEGWNGAGFLIPPLSASIVAMASRWYFDVRDGKDLITESGGLVFPLFETSATGDWQLSVNGISYDLNPDPKRVKLEDRVAVEKKKTTERQLVTA